MRAALVLLVIVLLTSQSLVSAATVLGPAPTETGPVPLPTPVDAICGNRITEGGEECDDGDTDNANGCTNACQKCALAGRLATVYGGAAAQCCEGLERRGAVCSRPRADTCTETDGGQDYTVQGRTYLPSGASQQDSCLGTALLREYSCATDRDGWDVEYYNCPNGCRNGACIQRDTPAASCSDSDGGRSIRTKGETCQGGTTTTSPSTTASGSSRTGLDLQQDRTTSSARECRVDRCLNPSMLLEGYCKESGAVFQQVACPRGSHCFEGACVTGVVKCRDTDNGGNIYTQGTITSYEDPEGATDYCRDATILVEHSCAQDGTTRTTHARCEEGCSNGACLRAAPRCEEYTDDAGCTVRTCDGAAPVKECVGCSKDLRTCPDGSKVGRVLPQCDFASCPESTKPSCMQYIDAEGCVVNQCSDGKIDRKCGDAQPSCTSGCEVDGKCALQGTRRTQGRDSLFCDLSGGWERQRALTAACENSYECTSNFCSEGECHDIAGELEEARSLIAQLQAMLDSLLK